MIDDCSMIECINWIPVRVLMAETQICRLGKYIVKSIFVHIIYSLPKQARSNNRNDRQNSQKLNVQVSYKPVFLLSSVQIPDCSLTDYVAQKKMAAAVSERSCVPVTLAAHFPWERRHQNALSVRRLIESRSSHLCEDE